MSTMFFALGPVFLLILLGFAFDRLDFPGKAFWPPLERLTYFVLFPALLIVSLVKAPLDQLTVAPMAFALILPVVILGLALLAARPWLPITGPAFSSVFQGSIRINTYVGLAIALALYHERGMAASALALAILIPVVNVFSVAVLATYASPTRPSAWQILRTLALNPLILGCLIGLLLNIGPVELSPVPHAVIAILGDAALPLGLLTVGAGLKLAAVRAAIAPVAFAVTAKLFALPLLALATCWVIGLHGLSATIVVLFCALPAASSSYILAGQLGGDRPLMASILTVQTALAVLTIPLFLALAGDFP